MSIATINKPILREFELTAKQKIAWKILMDMSQKVVALLYGGAKGGGKSFLLCLWVYMFSKFIIKLFKIDKPLQYPLVIGFFGRKQSIDFQKTTLETWKRTIPSEAYRIKEQAKEIIIDEKVCIWFGGLDSSETINKFNSAELIFCALDQSEECDATDLGVLEASLRLKYNGITPPYRMVYSANPADCHLKQRFVNTKTEGEYFVPALPSDNKHLPEGYIQTLEKAFSYDPKLLRAYRDGDWDVLMATNQLITIAMMDALNERHWMSPVTKKIIACDPSMGGDACVVKVFYNTKVVETQTFHERDTMKLVGNLAIIGARHSCDDYVIDSIGIGKGIVDRLVEMEKRVIAIMSADNATDDPEHFANVRAEIWAYTAKQILDKNVEPILDHNTRTQLVAVKFKVVNSNGKILLEPKDVVRTKLGRSPDDADTYVYGIWGLSRIDCNVKGEVYEGDIQGQGERVTDDSNAESEYINIR
jgi:disulfide oxidoreductase YuzD